MSTGALSCALALVACAGRGAGMAPGGDRLLVPDPAQTTIRPGGTGSARFVLTTTSGAPFGNQRVNFAIVDDDPNFDPKGATLVETSAVTDSSGVAAVDVQAGDAETTFWIRATTAGEQAPLLKVSVAFATANIEVSAFLTAEVDPNDTTGPDVRIYDGQTCADVLLAQPPDTNLPTSGGTPARFELVSTTLAHAVVGRALSSRHVVIAAGCVDIQPSSLIAGSTIEVWLPLRNVVPDPIGSYRMTSKLAFQPPLAAGAAIARPWRDLSDCPLDPAQLLLDCMVDALTETADDRNDCKPNSAPGGEGALGDAFAARRGTLIPDATGAPAVCRSANDASGAPSLDAIMMGLFGSPTPALVVALPTIANDAAHILDAPRLSSTLTVASAGLPDQYVVTHTLTGASFTSYTAMTPAEFDLVPLALPVLTAYTTATTRDRLLVIGSHGFTLRLGRVARAGFEATTLMPRKILDAGDFVAALAALAHADDGSTLCAAFNRALCTAVGSSNDNCLDTACSTGLQTLSGLLDAAFDAADGTGLDLTLSGSTPLLDPYAHGYATKLGSDVDDLTTVPGWSVDLRTAAGAARGTATLDGARN